MNESEPSNVGANDLWFYVDASRQSVGPITKQALLELKRDGVISWETLVVRVGGTEWLPFREVAGAAATGGVHPTGQGARQAGVLKGGFLSVPPPTPSGYAAPPSPQKRSAVNPWLLTFLAFLLFFPLGFLMLYRNWKGFNQNERTGCAVLLGLPILGMIATVAMGVLQDFSHARANASARAATPSPTVSVAPPVTLPGQIEVTIDVTVTQNAGKALVSGTTNLPDGMKMTVRAELLSGNSPYHAGDYTLVKAGVFECGPFSDSGDPLPAGRYRVSVGTEPLGLQSEEIRSIIGRDGELLTGPLVMEREPGKRQLAFVTGFTIKRAESQPAQQAATQTDSAYREAFLQLHKELTEFKDNPRLHQSCPSFLLLLA